MMTKPELKRYPITKITHQQYLDMVAGGKMLVAEEKCNKQVVLMPDGLIIKCLASKPCRSTRFRIQRYLTAAQGLAARGVNTMKIVAAYDFPEQKAHIICYYKLPGTAVSDLLLQYGVDDTRRQDLLSKTVIFLATLHQKGVNFRGCHAGNVLYNDQGEFALIDMEKAKFSVSTQHRAEGVYRFLMHAVEGKAGRKMPVNNIQEIDVSVQTYLAKAQFPEHTRKQFIYYLNKCIRKKIERFKQLGILSPLIDANYRYCE